MKDKVTITLLLLLFAGVQTVSAQNVIQVAAGQNTLIDAVASAQPGDIIELTDGGGIYINDDRLQIDKPLTIRAAAGLTEKPIMRHNGDQGTVDMIRLLDDLTLIGIEMDGEAPEGRETKYAIRSQDNNEGVKEGFNLKVIDCYIHDIVDGSDGNALRIYGPSTLAGGVFADSIIFRNTTIRNTGKQAIRVGLESGFSGNAGFGFYNANYFEFTNGTISDSRESAIGVYGGGVGGEITGLGTVVRVNHLTCNNCGHGGKRAVYAWDAYDTVVKNSIFTNSPGNDQVVRLYGPMATISHVDTLNIGGTIQLNDGAQILGDILNVDPEYVDAENGDFTLSGTSPLLTAADDGLALGDVRNAGQELPTFIEQLTSELPEQIALGQNYPNPFNPATTIPFQLDRQAFVQLSVFNILGQEVATLANQQMAGGEYTFTFEGQDLPSGTYIYSLTVDNQVTHRRMVLLK